MKAPAGAKNPKLGDLFEFRLYLDAATPMAKVECRDCGWTAIGRYREDVFPLAHTHPCPVRDEPSQPAADLGRAPAPPTRVGVRATG